MDGSETESSTIFFGVVFVGEGIFDCDDCWLHVYVYHNIKIQVIYFIY